MCRLPALIATLMSACAFEASPDAHAWLTRAVVHVDTSQPDALADVEIFVDAAGGDVPRSLQIDAVYAQPAPESMILSLAVDFPEDALFVPAHGYVWRALENKTVRNADLEPYCQTNMPMTVYFSVRDEPGLSFYASKMLTAFCP